MKTFPYIVINKSNMNNPKHYKDAQDVGYYLWNAHATGNYKNWIVIKDEKHVIDLQWLSQITELPHIKHSRLVKHLEKHGT